MNSRRANKHLVIGDTGLLGQALTAEFRDKRVEFIGASRKHPKNPVDLLKFETVSSLITEYNPDIVWNAAALTDVSECEYSPDIAYLLNTRAVGLLGSACAANGARLIHFSTDQLFPSSSTKLHKEESKVYLENEYARTKYLGERLALLQDNALIIRTNFTGFRNAKNRTFAEWAFDAIIRGKAIYLFDDYYTSTIDSKSLVCAAFELANKDINGVINLASREVSSKKEFVESIIKFMGSDYDNYEIRSVDSLRPRRSSNSGLCVEKAEALLGRRLPTLDQVIENLVREWKNQS